MKISVFIPCYNEEKYIGSCLNSLSHQTLVPDEVIICDNNSTDQSVIKAQKYLKKLNLKIVSQSQKGILPTVEKAWKSTTGDILIRTDADAIFPKDWIKNIVSHFQSDQELSACGGNWRSFDGSSLMKTIIRIALPFYDFINVYIQGYPVLLGPNTAIRRKNLVEINGYITSNKFELDDQLISKKLYLHKFKFRKFRDCWNFHSTRRYKTPLDMFKTALAGYFPKLYEEKST